MSRWVLVDDSDSGISYDGEWFQDKGSLDGLGNFGPPYLSTLHGIRSNGSFSYTFTGTRVLIIGTNQVSNSSGVTNPSFQCLVDGERTSVATLSTPENRLLLCEQDGLSVGQHQISVAVNVSNPQTFWLDYIQYLPTASVSLANAALSIDFTDSQIQYGSGWSSNNLGSSTSQNAATLSFQFTGISLTWLGYYANSQALLSTTATYSIDGQTPTSFSLRGGATGQLLNQIMFQTPQLSSGSHKLDIVYLGNSQSTPLTLNVLIVQNGTSNSGTSTTATTPIGTNSTHNSSNLGPIIGGVVGGLAVLLAIFGCLFLRRRRMKDTSDIAEPMVVEPFKPRPTATLLPTGSSKLPSSAGSSHLLVQHQQTGQVGGGHGGSSNPHSGSIPSLGRSGGSSSQITASHTRGISSSIDISSPESLMVQTRSDLQAPGIIRPRKELQLQSTPPVVARNDNPLIQPTRVIHEEDSGIRLPHADGYGSRVEVLPPRYTAG